MGAGSSFALKFIQWFIRGIQFGCCAVVLALYSYFLATLHNHNFTIATWVRAVEGISGVGVLYTAIGLLLLCCLAGHPFTSFIAIVLDIAFVGGFIYVAQANHGGASSCTGNSLFTPFGTGAASDKPSGSKGFTGLPTFRQACKMETACLAVSIVAIFFFIFSALTEIALVRSRRKEQRFGPSPANNYTGGYGSRRGGFLGTLFRRRKTAGTEDPNQLPAHTTPDEMRASYNTESTAVAGNEAPHYNKYGDQGYGHQYDGQTAYPETTGVAGSQTQPGHYRYGDGTYNAV